MTAQPATIQVRLTDDDHKTIERIVSRMSKRAGTKITKSQAIRAAIYKFAEGDK